MNIHFVRRFPSVEEGRAAKSIYLERAPEERYFTFYVTFSDPKDYTSSLPESLIGELVANAVGGVSQTHFVDTITDRDKLLTDKHLTVDSIVLVKDATGDERFKGKGGVAYFYSTKSQTFIPSFRMPEDPLALPKWSDFEGAPSSTGEDIDLAVEASHEHLNMETIDGLGHIELENGTKILSFNGRPVGIATTDNPAW